MLIQNREESKSDNKSPNLVNLPDSGSELNYYTNSFKLEKSFTNYSKNIKEESSGFNRIENELNDTEMQYQPEYSLKSPTNILEEYQHDPKTQEPIQIQPMGDSYRNDLEFYKSDESAKIIKEKNDLYKEESSSSEFNLVKKRYKKHHLIYTGFLLFIILLLSAFIPLTIILSKGTKITVFRYFGNSSPEQRKEVLSELTGRYISSNDFLTEVPEGSNLGGYNTYHGINPNYLDDTEIISLMNTTENNRPTFYGLAYTPKDSMEPNCGVTQREVLLDIAKLSTVTTRIRSYGVQCDQAELILNAFQELNLNMTLAMGVWIGSNKEVNRKQLTTMKYLLQKYPRKYFEYVLIGNEVLFREDLDVKGLSKIILETKEFLKEIGYDDIPVGTTEIGSLISQELTKSCDIIGANIHPFFGGGVVENASKWSFNYIKEEIQPNTGDAKICITEIGWPSGGGRHKGAVAGYENFNTFLNSFVCDAYTYDYAWFYFEAFDGPWKKIFYEGNNKWETQWGVFTVDRELKTNALPIC